MLNQQEFTHCKIYPNGDKSYTRVSQSFINKTQINPELQRQEYMARLLEYKKLASDPLQNKTFEELIQDDWYWQKENEKLNAPINQRIDRSARRVKTMVKDYTLCNNFTWFVTLTDKDQLHDRQKFSKRVRNWAKKLKVRHYPNLEYLIVLEQHLSGAWHAHAIFNDVIEPEMIFAKMRKGNESFNMKRWRFGWSTAEKILDKKRLSSYITKYITKDLFVEMNKQAYFVSQGLTLPVKEQGNYLVAIIDNDRYYANDDFATYYQDNGKTITS